MTVSQQFSVVRRSEVSIRGSIRPEALFYGGQVVGERAIRDVAEIGSKVIHTFHVVNDGPWPADSVNVHIDWPYQVQFCLHTKSSFLFVEVIRSPISNFII